MLERAAQIATPVHWHLIGHLQRNKVRKILPVAECLHSIDSLSLATRVDDLAPELGLRPRLLLEVNVSGEDSKDGFAPEQLEADWAALSTLSHVEIRGLMTMAPLSDEPEDSRATFQRLRELRDRLAARPGSPPLVELSMGMSGDFDVGIEEGATMSPRRHEPVRGPAGTSLIALVPVTIDKRQVPVRKKTGQAPVSPPPNLAAFRALKVDVSAANLFRLVI